MIKDLIILSIRAYQKYISGLFAPCCRFYPSCSEYAAQCVGMYGVLKGLWAAVKRIVRCHPFNPGGFDPPTEI